jgi:hypothetical protein
MHFIFCAPFRTGINLNSLVCMNYISEVVACLSSSVSEVQQSLPEGFSWEVAWAKDGENELHYSELSEDFIPLSATPLLRLHISIGQMNALVNEQDDSKSVQVQSIGACYIDYYDNTVAILFVDAELSFPKEEKEGFPLLDYWSTNWCSSVINQVGQFEKRLQVVLMNQKINKQEIFLKPKSFRVFFDQGLYGKGGFDAIDKILWVTRIYVKEKEETSMALLEEWTQQADLESKARQVGKASIAFCIGNSVVLNEIRNKEYAALMSAMSICTYFYVLHDVFNRNLKSVFISMASENNTTTSIISRTNKIRSHIEFIENEFSDVLLGLQGLRSEVATHLLNTWKYPELVKAVQRKKQTVGKMIDFSLQEKQGRYARVVEAILAAIGGVAVLDFALNLFTFTNNKELSRDSIPGLVDAAKHLPHDGVIYAILLILLSVLILVAKKR